MIVNQGNKWWQKSDEPWQTLACCLEIAKVVRSPDPEAYMCHLPVHQVGGATVRMTPAMHRQSSVADMRMFQITNVQLM